MNRALSKLEGLCRWTGHCVAWLTVVMVVVMTYVVIERYFFASGSVRLQESITYMHAAVLLLAAAYTLSTGDHVRVDIFYSRFSEKTKARVNLLGTLLLLAPFCLFLIWSSWDYVALAWEIRESSKEAGGLPFPFPAILKSFIPTAAILLLVQGCVIAGRAILTLTDHEASGSAQ